MDNYQEKYTLESVDYGSQLRGKSFVTSIGFSAWHWHYEYELMLVLKGKVTLRSEKWTGPVTEGNLVLVNSKELHSIVGGNEANLCGFVQLSPDLFRSGTEDKRQFRFFLNSMNQDEQPEEGIVSIRNHVSRILMCTLIEQEQTVYRLRGEMYSLVADLVEGADYDILMRRQKEETGSEELLDMIDYLRRHAAEDHLSAMLAHEFGVGEKTLYRYFKAGLGMSVRDFIEEMRVQQARKLLRTTDHDMPFIIDACGFGSEKTFYRSFQKLTGQTPLSYRKSDGGDTGHAEVRGYLDYERYEALDLLKGFLS